MISYFYLVNDFVVLGVRFLTSLFLIWYFWQLKTWRYFILLLSLSLLFGLFFHLIGFLGIIIFGIKIVKQIIAFNFKVNDFLIFLLLLILVFSGPGRLSIDFLFKIFIF